MKNEKIPINIPGISESVYAGFFVRFGSVLIDSVIFLFLLSYLFDYLTAFGMKYYLFVNLINFVFVIWYYVYLVKTYGGTPGKLLLGLKIIKISGSEINYKNALLREIVTLILLVISLVILIGYKISIIEESYFLSLSKLERNIYVENLTPTWKKIESGILYIWIYSELVVLLFNKRKRALHDFVAGTVVIKGRYEEDIRKIMGLDNR